MRTYLTSLFVAFGAACTAHAPLYAQNADTTPSPSVVVPAPASAPTQPVPVLAGDDFTHYASTAALRANISSNLGGTGDYRICLYNDGVNGQYADLDTTVRYKGHATMRYTQPARGGTTPQLSASFAPVTKIWYRAKIRFSPGWTDQGTLTNSSNAYKLLGWGWTGADGSGRLEIANTTQYDFYWNVQKGGTLIGGGNHAVAGNITTEWSDGGWYDYIIYVDHSGPTGIAKIWMARDGQSPTLRATVLGRMGSRAALPKLNRVLVGLNFNQVRTQTQYVWWGAWSVVDGSQYANPFGVQ